MKEIPLSRGQVAIVDDEFYDELLKYKWTASYNTKKTNFYARISFNGKRMHRLIMELYLGRELSNTEYIDHIDHNTLDNRLSKLRVVTKSMNCRNTTRRPISGLKWITYTNKNNKYRAEILFLGETKKIRGKYRSNKLNAAKECISIIDERNDETFNQLYHIPIKELRNYINQEK